MDKKELIRRAAEIMRERNIRKPVSSPKQVFHISDDEGNKKDFVVRKTDKTVLYTSDDLDAMLETCFAVIRDALRRGEEVTLRGFGTLRLKFRKPRETKSLDTGERIRIKGRYVPKFAPSGALKICAKMYEMSLEEGRDTEPLPDFYDDYHGDNDDDIVGG